MALNEYLEKANNFKEDMVQNWFEEFETKKNLCEKKIKEAPLKQSLSKQSQSQSQSKMK